jgi:RNA polymerase sigma-70 factor (ECF subfamily)
VVADSERSLAEFYAATYARLVGIVGAVGGDAQEAEEAVQDAFVRLIGRWPSVSTYDDPEAWVRKVALGKLSNRRRKVRNGWSALRRERHAVSTPGPDPLGVDLKRALAALPQEQRAVVVLRQLGLELAAIASELDVPVGTVKSRLNRARAALAPRLREDTPGHV